MQQNILCWDSTPLTVASVDIKIMISRKNLGPSVQFFFDNSYIFGMFTDIKFDKPRMD